MGDSLGLCGYDDRTSEKKERIFDFDFILGLFSVLTILSIVLIIIDSETKKFLVPYYSEKNTALFLIYCGISLFASGVFAIRIAIADAKKYFGWTVTLIFITFVKSIIFFGLSILCFYGGIVGFIK